MIKILNLFLDLFYLIIYHQKDVHINIKLVKKHLMKLLKKLN